MIQRIQSLYLLLAAIISGGLIFVFKLWSDASSNPFFAIDALKAESFLMKSIAISFFASSIISVVSVFMFKDRKLQFVLGRVNILINFYLIGAIVYQLLNLSGETTVSEKGIGVVLPILTVLLLAIANKAIKKDEDLVKSVDRLR